MGNCFHFFRLSVKTPMATSERPILRALIALVAAIGLGVGGLLFGVVLMIFAMTALIVGVGLELTTTLQLVLGLIFVQGIGAGGVALAYATLRPKFAPVLRRTLGMSGGANRFQIGVSVPDTRDLLTVGAGYVLAIGLAIAGSILVSVIASSLGVQTGTNQAAEVGMENPELLLLLIPASILLIGPGEELLFRGVVQGRLREVFDAVSGVLIASVLFAGLHWFALSGGSPAGNLIALVGLLGPAIVFGASYEYTGNIVVPSLIHGIYNATLFTLLYVYIQYSDQLPDAAMAHAATLL